MRFLDNSVLLRSGTKNDKGETLCRWCREPVHEKGRRWWHAKCTTEYLVRNNSQAVRAQLLKRDKGVCAECGMDCERLDRIGQALVMREARKQKRTIGSEWGKLGEWSIYKTEQAAKEKSLVRQFKEKYPWWKYLRSSWASAHIVAVKHGGGACGIENYRTLCVRCHNKEHAKK